MKKLNIRNLLTSIILVQIVGMAGALVTYPSINTWYSQLAKAPYSPPNWVFGPVWTILYVFMGTALYLVWQVGWKKPEVRRAIWLFHTHLAFNFGWSLVFFGLHSILGGMVMLVIVWGFIVALIKKFYPLNHWAAYLLVPYLLWVTFAGALNFAVIFLNSR